VFSVPELGIVLIQCHVYRPFLWAGEFHPGRYVCYYRK
jgi:hypothetical protein